MIAHSSLYHYIVGTTATRSIAHLESHTQICHKLGNGIAFLLCPLFYNVPIIIIISGISVAHFVPLVCFREVRTQHSIVRSIGITADTVDRPFPIFHNLCQRRCHTSRRTTFSGFAVVRTHVIVGHTLIPLNLTQQRTNSRIRCQ